MIITGVSNAGAAEPAAFSTVRNEAFESTGTPRLIALARSAKMSPKVKRNPGAYVACPNFPVYGFCWLRDGTFIAHAMDLAGRHDSSRRFYRWVDSVVRTQTHKIDDLIAKAQRGEKISNAAMLPTRYELDGSNDDSEWPQFQLDGYGAWLWGLGEHRRLAGSSPFPGSSDAVDATIRYIRQFWQRPCFDCWEEFSEYIHPSTLACLYGGLQTAKDLGVSLAETEALAVRIFVLDNFVKQGRFVKHAGYDGVDASLLWLSIPFGLVSPNDPRMQDTVLEIERTLLRGGVKRYQADSYYGGGNWILLTAWLGRYYVRQGRLGDAERLLDWIENTADSRGHLPEQVPESLNVPGKRDEWIQTWGPVATPLLWSHAMYIVLALELQEARVRRAG